MTNGRPRCVVIGIGNVDRGDDAAGRAVAGELRGIIAKQSSIGVKLRFGRATVDSLPPCGGGMGWGVVQYGTALPHRTTPSPIPSPQGGGEEFAMPANHILTPVGTGFANIEIIEHGGEATGLIAQMDGAEQLFLVDACVSGAPPGTIHRFDASSAPMPALRPDFSTHGFGLASAIELARALGQLPRRTVVYAIEGASFETGTPPSPPVATAVPEVARRLHAEIERNARPLTLINGRARPA